MGNRKSKGGRNHPVQRLEDLEERIGKAEAESKRIDRGLSSARKKADDASARVGTVEATVKGRIEDLENAQTDTADELDKLEQRLETIAGTLGDCRIRLERLELPWWRRLFGGRLPARLEPQEIIESASGPNIDIDYSEASRGLRECTEQLAALMPAADGKPPSPHEPGSLVVTTASLSDKEIAALRESRAECGENGSEIVQEDERPRSAPGPVPGTRGGF